MIRSWSWIPKPNDRSGRRSYDFLNVLFNVLKSEAPGVDECMKRNTPLLNMKDLLELLVRERH